MNVVIVALCLILVLLLGGLEAELSRVFSFRQVLLIALRLLSGFDAAARRRIRL